jgi:hypothetical protein
LFGCGVINAHSLHLIKRLSGGTHDVEPLESWGIRKGRCRQPEADRDGLFFFSEHEHAEAHEGAQAPEVR